MFDQTQVNSSLCISGNAYHPPNHWCGLRQKAKYACDPEQSVTF